MKSFAGLRYATVLEFADGRSITVFIGDDGLIFQASEYTQPAPLTQSPGYRVDHWRATA